MGRDEKWVYTEKTVRTSSLRYGHSLWGRGAAAAKYANQPLVVDKSGKVIDGNARLRDARARGQKTIRVKVPRRVR